ncbi:DUF5916 domain-containing protein [Candidatus Latescibacterota bacterium]
MHLLTMLLLFCPISIAAQPLAPATPVCTMDACFSEYPIVMDGLLTETCWDTAAPVTEFIQRDPQEGQPATEKTEVRVVYDDLNLYIGIICFDHEPARIVHAELGFDETLDNDDNFTFILDTYADARNGFYFSINPNGARLDARIGGRFGTSLNRDWNGVWDAAACITDQGWSAEIVIPFSSLRFGSAELQEWGINFRRYIARKNEEVLWAAWNRDAGITRLSQEGKLRNLKNVSRGKLLEVKPYILSGLQTTEGKNDDQFKYGVDAKYPLTSDLTIDFTSFTDFAQVEADRTQINITRFDLRYPENRDFFLEGAEIFDFGGSQATPYYSRRIGLTAARKAIPIIAGAKITGKTGKYNVGLFDMQTDSDIGVPSTNYQVFRVKRDVFEASSLGMIATGVYNENGHWDRTVGVDFSFRTDKFMGNKNFTINTDYSADFRDTNSAHNRNMYFQVQYPNDTLNMFIYYKEIGENYNPEVGFVERPGIKKGSARITYQPRPDLPYVKQLRFPFLFLQYADMSGRIFSRQINIPPFGVNTKSEDTFTLVVTERYEYLDKPFNIFKNVMIPVDAYDWWEGSASFASNRSRPFSTNLTVQFGDFYNGTKKGANSSVTMKFSQFLSIEGQMIYNDLTAGSESFSTQEYSLRLTTNVSPRLAIQTFTQWNNDDEELNLNFRIHFIPRVGSDIYFVYNRIWDGMLDYDTTHEATIAKVAWRFEF